ncbi:hypothetical protein BDV96DRAFT_640980 [Lophiotrema nucula]|uniref:Uncharacterized protein n=1 Tax=Lophiotrema nucula TaxID=690887 RepID=A0A6A5ZQR7_9PLEO|nr:hypothetical protein BDV96DRAFT_640980 [Lophiotrema nucula]
MSSQSPQRRPIQPYYVPGAPTTLPPARTAHPPVLTLSEMPSHQSEPPPIQTVPNPPMPPPPTDLQATRVALPNVARGSKPELRVDQVGNKQVMMHNCGKRTLNPLLMRFGENPHTSPFKDMSAQDLGAYLHDQQCRYHYDPKFRARVDSKGSESPCLMGADAGNTKIKIEEDDEATLVELDNEKTDILVPGKPGKRGRRSRERSRAPSPEPAGKKIKLEPIKPDFIKSTSQSSFQSSNGVVIEVIAQTGAASKMPAIPVASKVSSAFHQDSTRTQPSAVIYRPYQNSNLTTASTEPPFRLAVPLNGSVLLLPNNVVTYEYRIFALEENLRIIKKLLVQDVTSAASPNTPSVFEATYDALANPVQVAPVSRHVQRLLYSCLSQKLALEEAKKAGSKVKTVNSAIRTLKGKYDSGLVSLRDALADHLPVETTNKRKEADAIINDVMEEEYEEMEELGA